MPKQSPFFSIIMNCYNGEKYLREAIDSVLTQTFTDWELIFYDNCSNDQSLQIASSCHDARIQIINAPYHTELGSARRNAIKHTKGKWLAFLDVDDLWTPEKLEKQYRLITDSSNKERSLGIVYGKEYGFTGQNIVRIHPNYLPQGDVLKELLQFNFINSTNVIVLKDAYDAVGGFPTGYYSSTDYFLSCAVAKYYPAGRIDEVISKYRIHENNTTHSVLPQQNQEIISTLEMYLDECPNIWKKIVKLKLFSIRAFFKKALIQWHIGDLVWKQLQKYFRKLFPVTVEVK